MWQAIEKFAKRPESMCTAAHSAVCCQPIGQRSNHDPILALERNVGQCRRQCCCQRCFRWSAIVHGVRTVDEYGNRKIFLGLEDTQEKPFQSRICSPIDTTEVISWCITAVVRKLHGGTG